MLSIIIPTYNEAHILEKNMKKIHQAAKVLKKPFEILIVEESNDDTPLIVERLARWHPEIRHIRSEKRLGKGGAIEKGVQHARGEKIVFMDLDLSTNLSALPELVAMLDSHDIVIGSRYHPQSKTKRVLLRLFLSRIYSVLVRICLGLPYRDVQCGFKAFHREVAKIFPKIKNKSFFWDAELVFFARRAGFSVKEIPISWHETKENITTTWMMTKQLIKLTVRRFLW